MTMRKIAVTLPPDQVEAARTAVAAGRATSVSAYISEAIARREREDELAALLDELDQRYGAPSADDYSRADAALGL